MSLRTSIQSAIQKGVEAIGDLPERCTYTTVITNTYNTTTGAPAQTTADYTGVRVIFDRYIRSEIDGEAIRREDQKALVVKNHLTPIPGVNDKLTRADGTVWHVVSVATDPVNAAWELQVRRP